MKPPIKTWIYKGYQLIKACDTVAEASIYTRDSVSSVRKFLNRSIPSKRGFFYSSRALSGEEIMKLPFKDEEVDDESDDSQFYIQPNKEKRLEQLKRFIYPRLRPYWNYQPKHVAEFERQFLHQILNKL